MRARTAVAVLCLALASTMACTPRERALWAEWHQADPEAATAFALELERTEALGVCGEWHDLALSVGWDEASWRTLDRIMWRESKCLPHVANPSGASGLLQIMPMWADDCGGTRDALFDPAFNLACGLHVLDVQGWHAWSTY